MRQRTVQMLLCFPPQSAEPVAMGMLQGAPQSSHQSAAGYRRKPGLLPRRRSWDRDSIWSCLCVSVCRQGWVSAQPWHKEQNCGSCFFFFSLHRILGLMTTVLAPQGHQGHLRTPLVDDNTIVSVVCLFVVFWERHCCVKAPQNGHELVIKWDCGIGNLDSRLSVLKRSCPACS